MAIFGQTEAGIRIGFLLINAATILLVFALGKRLFGTTAAVVSSASYALLSVGPRVDGFAGHATHLVALAALAGLWLLLKGTEKRGNWWIFTAGLLLGTAIVMKQPGAVFAVFGGLYLLTAEGWGIRKMRESIPRLAWFGAGVILPFGLTCLVLWRAGVFAKFWFWTFAYAYQYGTNRSAAEGWNFLAAILPSIVLPDVGLWLLAGVGLSAFLWSRKGQAHAKFLVGLLLFSCIGLSAGLYFRRHYFILVLPALSLLVGFAITATAELLEQRFPGKSMRSLPILAFLGMLALSFYHHAYFLFRADPVSASQLAYWPDPFPETRRIARYLGQHASPGAKVAVLGSEPQIFFYSGLRSATGYIYMYSLTERQKYALRMQLEAIAEIEAAQPEYLVYVRDWVVWPESERTIFNWAEKYIDNHYERVAVVKVEGGPQSGNGGQFVGRTNEDEEDGTSYVFRRISP